MLYKFVSEITSYVKLGTSYNCNFNFLQKKKSTPHNWNNCCQGLNFNQLPNDSSTDVSNDGKMTASLIIMHSCALGRQAVFKIFPLLYIAMHAC